MRIIHFSGSSARFSCNSLKFRIEKIELTCMRVEGVVSHRRFISLLLNSDKRLDEGFHIRKPQNYVAMCSFKQSQ